MNIFELIKKGCNIQIVIENDQTGVITIYNEDSANIELIYNNSNNKITLNILGVASFTTEDITANNVFYFNDAGSSILIDSLGIFNQYYALVFACGSGGGGGGAVNSVTGSLPISSSGGANPNISISQAGASTNGFLNSTDWSTFNNKVGGSGVATRVAFWSSPNTITSNALLFWDNINNRLGVGGNPFGYKLNVIDANFYARFGTTAGNDVNAVILGNSVSSYIALCGNLGERKLLFGDGATGFANLISYNSNVIQFGYSKVLGGLQLPPALTQFVPQFYYSAGTNEHTIMNLRPDIQTTGGANLLRGVYYNPNKTTDTGTTQIAWENTEGDVIFGNLASSLKNITFVDENGKIDNSYLKVDTNNGIIYGWYDNVHNDGILLNFGAQQYKFGAVDRGNRCNIVIEDAINNIYAISGNNDYGFSLDFLNGIKVFGNLATDTFLKIDESTGGDLTINSVENFWVYCNNAGFYANGLNNISLMGDHDGRNNNTFLGINDNLQNILASANLLTASSGSNSGQHLKINVGGTDYVIQLLNP